MLVALGLLASVTGEARSALTFSLADPSQWHFAGTNIANATKDNPGTDVPGIWVQEEAGPNHWIRPESKATSEDGQLAVLTTEAFTTFNVSFDFTLGLPCADTPTCEFEVWGTAAFVFGATDSQHFKMLEFPYQGQQNRAEHFWAQFSKVDGPSGWRESLSTQGPVHGVTSANTFPHQVRAELGADGWLKAWVDGRPLAPVQVGAKGGYLGLATYNILGNEVARVGNVRVVGTVDSTAKPFDKTVKIGRGFTNIEAGPKVVTTYVGRMVRCPNGDLIAKNAASYLRTADNGSTWTFGDYSAGLGHMLNVIVDGKPALASYSMKPSAHAPCSDCGLPAGSHWMLIRKTSTGVFRPLLLCLLLALQSFFFN